MNTSDRQKPLFPAGTQVVTLREVISETRVLHPRGAVGIVVRATSAEPNTYRVRFLDGVEENFASHDLTLLAQYQARALGDSSADMGRSDLFDRVIFQCVIGSRAYGLESDDSDIDRRGFYLAPADAHWSLCGVPEQLECDETQEAYWEVEKFIKLALKSNPNVLECLYCPLVEKMTPLAEELIAMRESFLSKLVYQTFNGYVVSQFKKMQAGLRNRGTVKPKHVMHLIRLLITGIQVLKEGYVPVRVENYRDELLAIKQGNVAWEESEAWRKQLHREFDQALANSKLPERPDYEKADAYLIRARRLAAEE